MPRLSDFMGGEQDAFGPRDVEHARMYVCGPRVSFAASDRRTGFRDEATVGQAALVARVRQPSYSGRHEERLWLGQLIDAGTRPPNSRVRLLIRLSLQLVSDLSKI